jgi:uncharacterized spore protein YtfJ
MLQKIFDTGDAEAIGPLVNVEHQDCAGGARMSCGGGGGPETCDETQTGTHQTSGQAKGAAVNPVAPSLVEFH